MRCLNKYDEAAKIAEEALEINPDNVMALRTRADALLKLDQKEVLDEAIFYFRRSLKLEPDHAFALTGLAHAFERKKEKKMKLQKLINTHWIWIQRTLTY